MNIETIPAEKVDSPEFLRAWDIYLESGGIAEIKSINVIMKLLKKGTNYTLFLAFVDKKVVAIGLALFNPADSVAFVDYIAVAKEFRGRGIGSAMVKEIYNHAKRNGCGYIFINVNTRDNLKKYITRFYKNNMVKIIDGVNYSAPDIQRKNIYRYNLGMLCFDNEAEIEAQYVLSIMKNIYTGIYKLEESDELYTGAVKGIRGKYLLSIDY